VLEKYFPKPLENETALPGPQSCTSEKKHGGIEKRCYSKVGHE